MVVDKEQPRRLLYRKEEVGRGFVSVGLQMRLLSFLLGNGKVKWSNSKKCRAFSLLRCVNREIAPWVIPRAELKRCTEQRCAALGSAWGSPSVIGRALATKRVFFACRLSRRGSALVSACGLGHVARERERGKEV